MIQEEIVQGGLLYHAVHGLCRVDKIAKQGRAGKDDLSYSLVPKVATHMKVRFIIAGAEMEASGFHMLISLKEAKEILAYLEAGEIGTIPSNIEVKAASAPPAGNQAWDLAKGILAFSQENAEVKDQRKRQMLERWARGLVRELALVFKITLKETAAKIRKSLGPAPKINPSVLVALVHACED